MMEAKSLTKREAEIAELKEFGRHERFELHKKVQGKRAEEEQGKEACGARDIRFRWPFPVEDQKEAGGGHCGMEQRVSRDLMRGGGVYGKKGSAENDGQNFCRQDREYRDGAAAAFPRQKCRQDRQKSRRADPAGGASEYICKTVQTDELLHGVGGKTAPYESGEGQCRQDQVRQFSRKLHKRLLLSLVFAPVFYHKKAIMASGSGKTAFSFLSAAAAHILSRTGIAGKKYGIMESCRPGYRAGAYRVFARFFERTYHPF